MALVAQRRRQHEEGPEGLLYWFNRKLSSFEVREQSQNYCQNVTEETRCALFGREPTPLSLRMRTGSRDATVLHLLALLLGKRLP